MPKETDHTHSPATMCTSSTGLKVPAFSVESSTGKPDVLFLTPGSETEMTFDEKTKQTKITSTSDSSRDTILGFHPMFSKDARRNKKGELNALFKPMASFLDFYVSWKCDDEGTLRYRDRKLKPDTTFYSVEQHFSPSLVNKRLPPR